ncbi:MAG: methionine biosynthesis protein MetW [Planctomycetaceae bacterium]
MTDTAPERAREKQEGRPRYCLRDPLAAMTDEIIMGHIASGSRVVDLGCGDGRLLSRLRDDHECSVTGVELDEAQWRTAVSRGVATIRADLDKGLNEIPTDSFDVAVLSQTLQQVRHPSKLLLEMMRIAQRALVVVPNFGYWRVRWEVAIRGRAPVTENLPYEWYDTPNLHVMSLPDFRALVQRLGLSIVRERPIIRGRALDRALLPNLRADSALYVLTRS